MVNQLTTARKTATAPRRPVSLLVVVRLSPLEATLTQLHAVDLMPGDPPTLAFHIRAGRRLDQMRVPVAPGHLADAEALADRLRRHHELGA